MANLPLLREALALFEGLPVDQVSLDTFASNHAGRSANDPEDCRTIACGLGHLGMREEWQARGIVTTAGGRVVNGRGMDLSPFSIARALFSLPNDSTALELFGCRRPPISEDCDFHDIPRPATDKDVLIDRLRRYIAREEGNAQLDRLARDSHLQPEDQS